MDHYPSRLASCYQVNHVKRWETYTALFDAKQIILNFTNSAFVCQLLLEVCFWYMYAYSSFIKNNVAHAYINLF